MQSLLAATAHPDGPLGADGGVAGAAVPGVLGPEICRASPDIYSHEPQPDAEPEPGPEPEPEPEQELQAEPEPAGVAGD